MQKKIIALAVAGLVSGAVFAQAPGGAPGGRAPGGAPGGAPGAAAPSNNLTIYGRVDLSYVYSKSKYRKFSGIEDGNGPMSNVSALGFKGEENLGDGLKAVYQFEWGVLADRGQGPGFNTMAGRRDTWVGLAGKFGKVTFGRQNTPMEGSGYFAPTGVYGTNGIKPFGRFRANLTTMNAAAMRYDNAIAYNSPNFSGLEFMGIYGFGEKVNVGGGDDDNGAYKSAKTSSAGKLGLGAKYRNGPLYLAAAYMARADDDSLQNAASSLPTQPLNQRYGAKGWAIGAGYNFQVVQVYANYVREKANHGGLTSFRVQAGSNLLSPNKGSDKQAFWTIGLGVPVSTAGTVMFEYGQYKDYLKGTRSVGIPGSASAATVNDYNNFPGGGKAKGYMVGYRHSLSRRTSLYTYVSQFKNDKNVSAGWVSQYDEARTDVLGKKQTNFVAGIVHYF
jgi:predicted porin